MPIHLDTHDPDIDLKPGTTKSEIVRFLYTHAEYGFRPAEIRDRLDIPHGTATTTLKRLQVAGYIGKTQDGYYHAIEGREDLRRYAASLGQLDRMFQQPETAESARNGADVPDDFDEELEAELDELEAEQEK
jgi:DNA-binding MarR family transcriptional regulator